MGDVVSLAQDTKLWICNCGCSTFEILSDGTARCAACDDYHDVGGSGWSSWSATSEKAEDEAFRDVQGNGSVEFARRRVAQMASDESATTLIVIRRDGSLSTWSEVETEEQMQWLRGKLEQAVLLITAKLGGE